MASFLAELPAGRKREARASLPAEAGSGRCWCGDSRLSAPEAGRPSLPLSCERAAEQP